MIRIIIKVMAAFSLLCNTFAADLTTRDVSLPKSNGNILPRYTYDYYISTPESYQVISNVRSITFYVNGSFNETIKESRGLDYIYGYGSGYTQGYWSVQDSRIILFRTEGSIPVLYFTQEYNEDYGYTVSIPNYKNEPLTPDIKTGYLSYDKKQLIFDESDLYDPFLYDPYNDQPAPASTEKFSLPINLVANPSFDSIKTNGLPTDWGSLSPSFSVSYDDKVDGAASLLYTAIGKGGNAKQTINIDANCKYLVSLWIKVDNSTKGKAVFDTKDRFDSTCQFTATAADGNSWQYYSGVFQSGSYTDVTLRCFATSDFDGEAYFDNILLTKLQPKPTGKNVPLAVIDEVKANQDYTYDGNTMYTSFTFDGQRSIDVDGRVVKYFWSFSGGGRSEKPRITFSFSVTRDEPREYTTTLRVLDDDGQEATTYVVVSIEYQLTSEETPRPITTPAPAENLIINGSFEDDTNGTGNGQIPVAWKIPAKVGYTGFGLGYLSSGTPDGIRTMHYNGQGQIGTAKQTIALKEDTEYLLSVYLRIDTTQGKVIFDTNDRFDETCQFQHSYANNDEEFKQFTCTFNSGDFADVTLRCYVSKDFDGMSYWDGVELSEIDPTPYPVSITIQHTGDGFGHLIETATGLTIAGSHMSGDIIEWEPFTPFPGSTLVRVVLAGTQTEVDPSFVIDKHLNFVAEWAALQIPQDVPPFGSIISLFARATGNLVSADNPGNKLISNKNSVSVYEQFEVVDTGDGFFALKCIGNNKYVCAEFKDDGRLTADRVTARSWERFTWFNLIDYGSTMAFTSKVNKKFISVDKSTGSKALIANSDEIKSKEIFVWVVE